MDKMIDPKLHQEIPFMVECLFQNKTIHEYTDHKNKYVHSDVQTEVVLKRVIFKLLMVADAHVGDS